MSKDYSTYPGSDMYDKREKSSTMEDEVEKLVDDYGAPENITDAIKEFLFDSGNIYTIAEIIKWRK